MKNNFLIKINILSLILLFVFFSGPAFSEINFKDPLIVAESFLEALKDGNKRDLHKLMIKKLINNNHWINFTKKDRKKIVPHWKVKEFRQKSKYRGYAIIETPHGKMAVKFLKVNNKWLWANE